MKKYTLTITASLYGTKEEFYRKFSKGNREVIINVSEFEDTDESHHSGYIVEDFRTNLSLYDYMTDFFSKNLLESDYNFSDEYYSIREKGQEEVIFTEDDYDYI